MSDDKLAERIYQAAFDRHVLIDRTDCEALAAAARAFIGDEIHAHGGRYNIDAGLACGPPALTLYEAEQIARGDTK
ncbi:hypothetical protein DUY81_13915 [Acidipropionibacterium acidipropionici]|uniref:Uncharacterized protein n=1 Tax=Acidipropionibacterium acidipropionici TaxID=1748 RepID=A0AAC9AP20_9ACTN|nr:hypothetical protein [Acidipropionibacterium acidipropionici]AMS06474.1 hypothetical protein AXH35_14450 [Acidipropionibacterium acidipropionici]AOZ47921.1 hypothetical protein A8L58_15905 [Acidipropionibacterium acidipropionici]AZP38733.1 hypothetical protein DUY81_13915 [Acidipropionibacterium acidipropionici]